MKHFRRFSRLTALLLALSLVFSITACDGRPSKTPDEEEPSSSKPQIPSFINPLPDVDFSSIAQPEPPSADILEKINNAYKINSDVVGWLWLPNTTIDDPVVQTTDNLFYERKNLQKAYDWYGSYWADYEVKIGDRNTISHNTIIYGHSMDDNPEGLKWSQLKKYRDIEFAAKNPYIYFSTTEDTMVWKVFSSMNTDVYSRFNYAEMNNADFMNLVTDAKNRSDFDYDVDVNATDKILTLSTCTYPTNNKSVNNQVRYVIMARLLRPGEKIEDTVKVEVNSDKKAPQIK